jgi:hypothetical protein
MVPLCRGGIPFRQPAAKQLPLLQPRPPGTVAGGKRHGSRLRAHRYARDSRCLLLAEERVLITRFSPTQIDKCFKLWDLPPMGDRHPLAYLSDIMALLPADGNLLVNAIFLRGQTEAIRVALADKAELPPFELAQAAARLI